MTSLNPSTTKAPNLCDYSSSSSDEQEKADPSKSPKKRKKSSKTKEDEPEDPLASYPLNTETGDLDVTKLLDDPSFDPVQALEKQLERLIPGFNDSSDEEQESTEEERSRNEEHEFDIDTFELRPIFKRPKEDWEDDEEQGTEQAEPHSEPSTSEDFRKPKLRNRKFSFKPFKRDPSSGKLSHDETGTAVDVIIPEQLAASYGLYLWPSSPVLSWYLWLHQDWIRGKRVLELGAGTALPGLLSAKLGAEKVYLADVATDHDVLDNCKEAVRLNSLESTVDVIGITWGSFDADIFRLENGLDYIIGSDVFFDPEVFEPLCVTLSFLLERNPKAEALVTVQDRSGEWSLEEYFDRYKLKGEIIRPEEFLRGTGIDEGDLTGKHTIFVLRIRK